jgi:cobalt-zinc-cadmium resistance protein CzcA
MLERIISFSVKNKLVIGLLVVGLIGFGIYSMQNIPIDAVPDITNNQVQIVTTSPSLSSQEVEKFITYPVEMSLANIQDVIEIRSISRYGLSVITVVFDKKVPILDARQLVGQQLQIARQEIPEGYGSPQLMPITTGLGEIFQYTIDVKKGYEEQYSLTELRTIHDWIVKRQLNGIPGIVDISSFGGFLKEYEVSVDPELLRNYNLTLLDVNESLKKNNQNTGGSYIQRGPYNYYIRANGIMQSIKDIKNTVVTTKNNIPILVQDIATVRIGHPPRFGVLTKDGKGEAVGGITLMLKGANASKVIKNVKNRVEEIRSSLPEGIELNAYLDRSELVSRVINTVRNNLIEGGLIVIFILVLLLGNFRSGLIVASVIPLSMLFAFGLMYQFDVTATVMSLGAIDFGLIIDATVIIVESIVHNLEKVKPGKALSGEEMDNNVIGTTSKIKKSAAFGAIIILIVYFPILTLQGIEGKMFRPMAMTVSFAIIGALILSFTYVPMMSALFLNKKAGKKLKISDKIMDFLYRSYRPVFNMAMKYKLQVIVLAVAVLGGTIYLFDKMGAQFLPELNEGDLAMQMTIPAGSSLNESIKTSTKAENILLDNFPEVDHVISKIGTAEVPTDPMNIEDADIMIILKNQDEWESANRKDQLVNMMKDSLLKSIPHANFDFTMPIQLRFNELLTGTKADVAVKIYGEDLDMLHDKAVEASKIIDKVKGAADVKVEQTQGLPQMVIDYKRDKLAMYGLNINDVNTMVRTALAGEKAGVIFKGQRKFDLVVRLLPEYRKNFEEFSNLFIKTPTGNQVPITEVANINFTESPMQISRDNTHRRISIGINVRNRDVKSMVEEIQKRLDENLSLPPGYRIVYGGNFENLQSAVDRLKVVVPLALVLIFIMLYFAFRSIKQALIIYTTIPLATIGGVFMLWFRGMPFSISAGVGFIALFGVAVLDGIVLINHLNELKAEGKSDLNERIRIATRDRLRPVIITSAVAALGFIPMATATSTGAEVQRPLATVVIGGLVTSTLLTMIVLPIIYYFAEKIKPVKIKTNLSALILLVMIFGALSVDKLKAQELKSISLLNSIDSAIMNNPKIQNSKLQVSFARKIKKSSLDFGNTSFDYQYGQINSAVDDYSIAVKQNIGNPFEKAAQNKLNRAKIEEASIDKQINIQQIVCEIVTMYYNYNIINQRKQLLIQQNDYYKEIIEIANQRYNTGESNYLEKLNLESQKDQIQLDLKKVNNQLKVMEEDYHSLLYTKKIYKPQIIDSLKIPFLIGSDTISEKLHTSLAYKAALARFNIAQKQYLVQKNSLMPELYAGYFNQQIDHISGFEGVQAGLSIPIVFFSQKNKVQAAKIQSKIAANNVSSTYFRLQKRYRKLLKKHRLYTEEIAFYEKNALKRSDLMVQNAQLLYSQGSINYLAFIKALDESVNIKSSYFKALQGYNLNALKIYKLLNIPIYEVIF